MIHRLCMAVLLLGCAAGARAGDAPARDLSVTGAWARPTPPGIVVGVVYFAVHNAGLKADRLLAVSSPVAAGAQIHETRVVDGVMQMRDVATVECPAGATIKSEPGGLHVMLTGLERPLRAGMSFPLTLRFRDAGPLVLQVPVRDSP